MRACSFVTQEQGPWGSISDYKSLFTDLGAVPFTLYHAHVSTHTRTLSYFLVYYHLLVCTEREGKGI